MKLIVNYNGFVTDSLQNTLFYVLQRKGLKWHEGKQMTELKIFGWTIPIK